MIAGEARKDKLDVCEEDSALIGVIDDHNIHFAINEIQKSQKKSSSPRPLSADGSQ